MVFLPVQKHPLLNARNITCWICRISHPKISKQKQMYQYSQIVGLVQLHCKMGYKPGCHNDEIHRCSKLLNLCRA